MTTPNIEELMKMLRAKGCPDWVTARWLMESAADALQSQTERIAELEQELKTAQEGWRCECSTDDACRFARERDTLRAQLEQIAATEPVAARVWIGPYWIDGNEMQYVYSEVGDGEPLFTRPMPAQDVTELVDALEKLARLGNGDQYGNSDDNMIARMALNRYKGAK